MRAPCKKPCVICRFSVALSFVPSDRHRPEAYTFQGNQTLLYIMYFRTLVHFLLRIRTETGSAEGEGGECGPTNLAGAGKHTPQKNINAISNGYYKKSFSFFRIEHHTP